MSVRVTVAPKRDAMIPQRPHPAPSSITRLFERKEGFLRCSWSRYRARMRLYWDQECVSLSCYRVP
jgi:hypothetical protein